VPKRIGESTADDSRGWIFAEMSTINNVTKYHAILISRYFLRQYIIVGISQYLASLIPTTDTNLFTFSALILLVGCQEKLSGEVLSGARCK